MLSAEVTPAAHNPPLEAGQYPKTEILASFNWHLSVAPRSFWARTGSPGSGCLDPSRSLCRRVLLVCQRTAAQYPGTHRSRCGKGRRTVRDLPGVLPCESRRTRRIQRQFRTLRADSDLIVQRAALARVLGDHSHVGGFQDDQRIRRNAARQEDAGADGAACANHCVAADDGGTGIPSKGPSTTPHRRALKPVPETSPMPWD